MDHTADWWLGDLAHPWFRALEGAIRDEWGTEPLRIREGGVSERACVRRERLAHRGLFCFRL